MHRYFCNHTSTTLLCVQSRTRLLCTFLSATFISNLWSDSACCPLAICPLAIFSGVTATSVLTLTPSLCPSTRVVRICAVGLYKCCRCCYHGFMHPGTLYALLCVVCDMILDPISPGKRQSTYATPHFKVFLSSRWLTRFRSSQWMLFEHRPYPGCQHHCKTLAVSRLLPTFPMPRH